jgi:DNA-directed RNA polymerase subunit alpha
VDELELSVRSQNCLQNAGIEYIYQLVERSEAEMLKTKNFGRKSAERDQGDPLDLGLSLGMKLHNFPKHRIG